jgi:serine/threonine protein kinase
MWGKLFEASVGVQYLHARGVIHGDLKCNNIVVGGDGKAKVTDFGLSSNAALRGKDEAKLTGAWHWVAPECLERGVSEQSTASDVYSLGMCIVEALRVVSTTAMEQNDRSHALLPWENMDNAVVKHYVVREHRLPLRPDQCSDVQWALVERMCAHNPADRLKIGTVVDELATLAGVQLRDGADTTLHSPLSTSQSIQVVIGDMRRSCHSRDVCSISSDQRVLSQIYELLWTRLEHLVDKKLDRAESLRQLIDKAASSVPDVQNASVTLVQFTESALQGYSLHCDLDKLMDANRWRIDEDEERVHDWKAKCYSFLGVH